MKKKILILGLMMLTILCISIITKAADSTNVQVSRNVYSNNGSMKFNFTGLSLDTTHEYEYGFTKTVATTIEKWYLITEYTATTATIDITTTTKELREVINTVDTGYITIKDKTIDTVVLQPYAVNLKIPYLQLTNYTVINNGKEFGTSENDTINVALKRNRWNSEAYYQYEKITDENLIRKYKEIKKNNGNYLELESMLKTSVPNSKWTEWKYWNSMGMEANGFGYPEEPIKAPSTGLYYMWVYFSGNSLKPLYGVILVDNLQPEVDLESISLPKTATVKMGQTIQLSLQFNPSGATNKIVTWSSSDESVATVNNAGKITSKKVGSTIITAVSQDGNKKATCTVIVIPATNTNNTNNDGNSNGSIGVDNSKDNNSNGTNNKKDETTATGKLPQTGIGKGITIIMAVITIISLGSYVGYRRLKGIM